MKIMRFTGATVSEALERVKGALGPDAIILDTLNHTVEGKKVVEVVAAIDEELLSARSGSRSRRDGGDRGEEKIAIESDGKAPCRKHGESVPTIYGFIGPNGCGKTQTLLKFATLLKKRGERAVLANADQKRLGARETLKRAASLLEVPFVNICSPMDLLRVASSHGGGPGSKILVDFPGINFFDEGDLGYLRRYFVAVPSLASICVVDACLHPSDLEGLMEKFEEFSPCATVVTKLDQARDRKRMSEILASVPTSIVYVSRGESVVSGLEEYYSLRSRPNEAADSAKFQRRESISGIHP